MHSKISSLLGASGSIREILLRSSIGSFTLKIFNALFGVATSILLARSLGIESFGIYTYIITIVLFLALLASAGVPALLVRETAKLTGRCEWGCVHGIWRWGAKVVAIFSIFILIFSGLIGLLVKESNEQSDITVFFVSLFLIPLFALSTISSSALCGLKRVVLGELSEFLIRPLLFLFILISIITLDSSFKLTPVSVITIQFIAVFCSLFIGIVILLRVLPKELSKNPAPTYDSTNWLKSLAPLTLISTMAPLLQYTDILMVGIVRSTEEVALYRVAMSVSFLVAFGFHSVHSAIGPHLAHLYHNGDIDKFRRLVTLSTRAIMLFALPVVGIMIIWGKEIIIFFYGFQYEASYLPLVILIFAHLINAAMGTVAQILNMTGHERDTAKTLMISVVLNIILNSVLIPVWGINGAALATATTIIIRNILLRRLVMMRLGVETLAIDFSRNKS